MGMDETPKPAISRPAVDFLRAELLTGRTLSNIALRSLNQEKRTRNQANARKAYDAILRFLAGSKLDVEQAAEIKSKLEELQSDLRLLGEQV